MRDRLSFARLALVGIFAMGLAAAACAESKPPMVPDSPDPTMGDGGADTPAPLPSPAAPGAKK